MIAGEERILEEHLWDLKHVEWTVTLQMMQGTGLELVEKTFLQSSQLGWWEDMGLGDREGWERERSAV